MPRFYALLFAVVGIVLLLGVSFFISGRSPGWALLSGVVFIFWTGAGFMVKARFRRKQAG